MGRDILSMILCGGRISLISGFISAAVSLIIAFVTGVLSASEKHIYGRLLTKFTAVFTGIPAILLVILFCSLAKTTNLIVLSAAIGVSMWPSAAVTIRAETKRLLRCDYIKSSVLMGAGGFYLAKRHFIPAIMPSISYIAVMNVRNGIMMEATLSFMGAGLPVETVSWGTMLSITQNAILSSTAWALVVPGAVLTAAMFSLTGIAESIRS